jgi:hypothetical protein
VLCAVPSQEERVRSARQTAPRVYDAFERTRAENGLPLLAEEPRREVMKRRYFRPVYQA